MTGVQTCALPILLFFHKYIRIFIISQQTTTLKTARTAISTDNSVDAKVFKNDEKIIFDSINFGEKVMKKKEK